MRDGLPAVVEAVPPEPPARIPAEQGVGGLTGTDFLHFYEGCDKIPQAPKSNLILAHSCQQGFDMALPAQYAKITLWFADGGDKVWSNTFWYTIVGPFSPTFDIAAAATSFQSNINTDLLSVLSSDSGYLGLDLRINNNGVSGDSSTFPAAVGTGAAGGIPNEVAAVVHLQTATSGKSGRGRSFWAGFPAADVAGGRVQSAYNTLLSALFTKLMTPITIQGQTWNMCLYSRLLASLLPIASFVVDALVGTQRRRRPRR